MKIICDTNVFIHYFNGNQITHSEIRKIGLENVIMPSIAAMELFRGMQNKNQMAQMIKRVKDFNILQADAMISKKAFE